MAKEQGNKENKNKNKWKKGNANIMELKNLCFHSNEKIINF